MTELHSYTVRPFSKAARKDLKDIFYIYLSPIALRLHKLQAGDVCLIWKDDSQKGKAIAWTATEKLDQTVVQMSRSLQSAYKFSLGDKVFISKADSPIGAIRTVYLEEIPLPGKDETETPGHGDDHWECMLEEHLDRAEYVGPGMVFEDVVRRRCRRSFRVKSIDDQNGGHQSPARFTISSKVKIVAADAVDDGATKPLKLSNAHIAGLTPQIQVINEVFGDFNNPYMSPTLNRPGGLLLYGPAGTGKSMLLKKIAGTGWGTVFTIDTFKLSKNNNEAALNIRRVFEEAKGHPRSIIIIDDLDRIASKEDSQNGKPSHTSMLRFELMALQDLDPSKKILVAAATNCLDDVDYSLRGAHWFQFEIEIPIPNAKTRIEIIKSNTRVPLSEADILLEKLGERTHGYTRRDLFDLTQMALRMSGRRRLGLALEARHYSHFNCDTDANGLAEGITACEGHGLNQEDIDKALKLIRPTAMREISLEVPKVRWSDIGGQEDVKKSLKQTIEWPLTDWPEMERLGLRPKKGVLLYGPPGCSKTLIARALATESSLNFLAVKGGDFINMYVGESERKLREIFAKARAASPSIIFFDEIDAIAKRREDMHTGGLNVLTTLLTEMDGIEPLRGVTVLAATNKPWLLDSALIRPGRLDTILPVGLPDLDARREILKIELGRTDQAEDVSLHELAQEMDGYTGAEIVSICNDAGHLALEHFKDTGEREQISRSHFNSVLARVERSVTQDEILEFKQWRVRGINKV